MPDILTQNAYLDKLKADAADGFADHHIRILKCEPDALVATCGTGEAWREPAHIVLSHGYAILDAGVDTATYRLTGDDTNPTGETLATLELGRLLRGLRSHEGRRWDFDSELALREARDYIDAYMREDADADMLERADALLELIEDAIHDHDDPNDFASYLFQNAADDFGLEGEDIVLLARNGERLPYKFVQHWHILRMLGAHLQGLEQ